ncbi:MAG: hypothetical protein US43_C0031G0006 [Candidatus Levybacteria bacterium GW2011_GWA1_37_16]|nr:MAG: hypothetical protein US43_C0031G0006 [Candidatus Levybacteria bacterium GW2011_GWA1_37_16]KKQ41365.1 MAG: hypothetical protein US59_C0035G0008 [Candidatus Levybacteria bacterium GW2011_GWB1_37_8]
MKKKYRYKNLFLYSSLQFIGNIEEYFVGNTEKIVAFIIMPRLKHNYNLIRLYKKGELIEEKKVRFSENVILYYLLWYCYQIFFLMRYFSRNEKVFIITFHPISFFGMSLQKMLRRIEYVYWIGDYFPPVNLSLRLFEKLKKHYHDKILYGCYLSDRINKKLNGKILNTPYRRTIMWGVDAKPIKRESNKYNFSFLFVGQITDSQGLDFFYEFLKSHKEYSIKIIGICDEALYKKHQKLIKDYDIINQVYFPNKFFSNEELEKISKSCHVGVALYKLSKLNATYYTDPGKIKTYAQLGLPILMSDISAIASYIKKFNAGEVITLNKKSIYDGIVKIRNNYDSYTDGLEKFNRFFYYESYYRRLFSFLEN